MLTVLLVVIAIILVLVALCAWAACVVGGRADDRAEQEAHHNDA